MLAHDHILHMLGSFPVRGLVAQWLKAGVVEQGRLHRTDDGVPQGGVVSPLLLNIALHEMEQAAGVRYDANGWARADSPVLIRYADDLVALCHTRQQALEVKARLAAWLVSRGLPSTRTRRASSPLTRGRVGPGRGAGVAAGPFPRPACRTGRARSRASGSPQDARWPISMLGHAAAAPGRVVAWLVAVAAHGEGMR
jgi:hypothetical protein